MPRIQLDKFDLEAEKEASAIRVMRNNGSSPAILGKRISGAKSHYTKSKTATSHLQNRYREEKIGFGA